VLPEKLKSSLVLLLLVFRGDFAAWVAPWDLRYQNIGLPSEGSSSEQTKQATEGS